MKTKTHKPVMVMKHLHIEPAYREELIAVDHKSHIEGFYGVTLPKNLPSQQNRFFLLGSRKKVELANEYQIFHMVCAMTCFLLFLISLANVFFGFIQGSTGEDLYMLAAFFVLAVQGILTRHHASNADRFWEDAWVLKKNTVGGNQDCDSKYWCLYMTPIVGDGFIMTETHQSED